MGIQKWTAEETKQIQATANACFNRHDHLLSCRDKLTLDNCSACILAGRKPLSKELGGGPNCCGWGRLYVEAQRPIPKKWRKLFEAECFSDNKPYSEALRRSIKTFGYPRFV